MKKNGQTLHLNYLKIVLGGVIYILIFVRFFIIELLDWKEYALKSYLYFKSKYFYL